MMTLRFRPSHTARSCRISSRCARLAQMRKAGIVNWGAHQLIGSLVAPGVTTKSVDTAVESYFAERNAIPLFKGVPGKTPFPSVCCMSRQR